MLEVGTVVNRLTVVEHLGLRRLKTGKNANWYLCRCECGNTIDVIAYRLNKGIAKSCGCDKTSGLLKFAAARPHNRQKHTKEYDTWANMRQRVTNPNYPYYATYSKLGADSGWLGSFEAFFQDVGTAPSSEHTLERLNNNVGYYPGNVVWALPEKQARNVSRRRNNKTGVTGVMECKGVNGNIVGYYATWSNLDRKGCVKYFSNLKYEDAFASACEYRAKMITELNAQGAGYSETHGLPKDIQKPAT